MLKDGPIVSYCLLNERTYSVTSFSFSSYFYTTKTIKQQINMSKTTEILSEKCRTFIAGMQQHLTEVQTLGIQLEQLQQLDKELQELDGISRATEALREELHVKVGELNRKMDGIKSSFQEMKSRVKSNYPQDQWQRYGVTDKR